MRTVFNVQATNLLDIRFPAPVEIPDHVFLFHNKHTYPFNYTNLFECRQIVCMVGQGIMHAKLQIIFGQIHVFLQAGKRNFRLDHPKFRQMPRGVAVFGPESGAKSVDVAHGAGVGFHVELPADGEPRLHPEEVLSVVHFTGLGAWQITFRLLTKGEQDEEEARSEKGGGKRKGRERQK